MAANGDNQYLFIADLIAYALWKSVSQPVSRAVYLAAAMRQESRLRPTAAFISARSSCPKQDLLPPSVLKKIPD